MLTTVLGYCTKIQTQGCWSELYLFIHFSLTFGFSDVHSDSVNNKTKEWCLTSPTFVV